MAVIFRGIFGLRLRAQHDIVDELLGVTAFDARENAIERFRLEHAALGEGDIERCEEFAQCIDLFDRRLVVHAIDQRHARLLEGFGGGDVGHDHEFLDQAVRFQPFGRDHAVDGAVAFQQDLAFGKIEIERLALGARAHHRFVGGVERREDRLDQRLGVLVGASADRELRLLVGQLRRRSHHDAVKGVRALAAVGADDHAHRKRGAVFAGRSEHRSFEMRSGSIGTTRSGK